MGIDRGVVIDLLDECCFGTVEVNEGVRFRSMDRVSDKDRDVALLVRL